MAFTMSGTSLVPNVIRITLNPPLTPYLSSAVNDANAALANLDAAFQQAAATGFTRIDVSLDPATLSLNITLT